MRQRFVHHQLGFTIIELLMVIVIMGIMGTYAVIQSPSVADATLQSQAQTLSSDLRHVQLLAITSNRVLCFRSGGVGSNTYSVTQGLNCPSSPVITDPVSGAALTVQLQKGLVFGTGVATTLVFDGLGRPVNSSGVLLTGTPAASFPLSSGTALETVSVERVSGRVY